ncbi:MAG: hypothetical protein CTY31_02480 [Hyphomicrobium sp.]|nr:MAG: hypothetical protein CTY39_09090 [Hyphomicrobium sp.]PPD01637.1 MAG: hypothetical protein CTY31_02480 [Hyphomicrobium sp.]
MSIESLMSAAHAAGYVMVAEEELPENFGSEPSIFEFKSQPATSLAIWRPVVPSLDGSPVGLGYQPSAWSTTAWGWLSGRFAGGAPA